MLIHCYKCKKDLETKDFYPCILKAASKHGFAKMCKKCYSAYQVKYFKEKKKKVVKLLGGKCAKCEYCRNLSALHLHHLDPTNKKFDWRKLRLMKWETVLKEINKCILLCSNCHAEEHNPTDTDFTVKLKKSITNTCVSCNKETFNKQFCSPNCYHNFTRRAERPSKDMLIKDIEELGYCGTGRKYGVTDNTIRKWLKTSERTETRTPIC